MKAARRNKMVRVLLTKDELAEVRAAAKAVGLSASAIMRERTLASLRRSKRV